MSGTLYLVGTPIGNLKDITLRALEVLRSVDAVYCEDTRRTSTLLRHYGIEKRLVSCYDAVEERRAAEVVEELSSGRSVALVTDSGMPLVSDPGYRILRRVREAGMRVEVVPGPTAFVAAWVLSGLPVDRLVFLGFLPLKGSKARRVLERIAGFEGTVALYESPHRLMKTLDFLAEEAGVERVVLVREITKVHEEVITGTLDEVRSVLAEKGVRGEYVVLFENPRKKG